MGQTGGHIVELPMKRYMIIGIKVVMIRLSAEIQKAGILMEGKRMLEYKDFSKEIREQVAERMGDGYRVTVNKVRKTNMGLVEGIIILKGGDSANAVSPNFYLPLLFAEYNDGKDMKTIVEEIVGTYYEKSAGAGELIQDIQNIQCYEEWSSRIYFRLINTGRNLDLLEEVPHFELLDLSMVFYVLIREDKNGLGSLMVRNDMLKAWEVSPQEIKQQAVKNTVEMLPVRIEPMRSVMAKIWGKNGQGISGIPEIQELPEEELKREKMFILTNHKMLNGFAAILYPNVLKEFAERIGRNLYILPSSTHEAILLPADSLITVQELYGMVREVNDTVVSREEVVSNSVYFYDKEEDKLMLAKGEEAYV